jgi:UDP-N-acetylmuramate dehydrogenase
MERSKADPNAGRIGNLRPTSILTEPVSKDLLIRENVVLAPLTTLGVGGPARYFAVCRSTSDILEALEFADRKKLPVFVLGGGSNLLIADEGFRGIVIQVLVEGIDLEIVESKGLLIAGSGENWDMLVQFAVTNDLAGVECLSGIPGSVGGTPVQNVGAYGQEVSETILSVACIDRSNGNVVEMTNEECGFQYRKSIFNTTERDHFIITQVTFGLMRNGKPRISYRDLAERFSGSTPSLLDVRDAVWDIRRQKSMVIDAGDPNSRSAGSFFKNPVLSSTEYRRIIEEFPIEVPSFPMETGEHKIPAAWLIEQAGFQKGFILGRVGISERHSLAIINRGGAKASDIIALKDLIISKVAKKFGITLVPEPVFLGFAGS